MQSLNYFQRMALPGFLLYLDSWLVRCYSREVIIPAAIKSTLRGLHRAHSLLTTGTASYLRFARYQP